jgi:hypothetical protein
VGRRPTNRGLRPQPILRSMWRPNRRGGRCLRVVFAAGRPCQLTPVQKVLSGGCHRMAEEHSKGLDKAWPSSSAQVLEPGATSLACGEWWLSPSPIRTTNQFHDVNCDVAFAR